MKAIIYNTGFEADGIKSGEKQVIELAEAEALAEKWGGMMKVITYEEPNIPEVKRVQRKVVSTPKKESIIKKTIKKLKK